MSLAISFFDSPNSNLRLGDAPFTNRFMRRIGTDAIVTRNFFPFRQDDAIENLFEKQHCLATDIGTVNGRNLRRIKRLDGPTKMGNPRVNQRTSLWRIIKAISR